jgi:hypothetical protein
LGGDCPGFVPRRGATKKKRLKENGVTRLSSDFFSRPYQARLGQAKRPHLSLAAQGFLFLC